MYSFQVNNPIERPGQVPLERRRERSTRRSAGSEASGSTPITDALERVTAGLTDARLAFDAAVVLGSTVLALALGAATLRRRTV